MVIEGAVLTCTLGTSESELQVPDFHGVSNQGKNAANIDDYKGNHNIPPFGKCKRTDPPPGCTPAIVSKWLNGQEDHTLDYELALLEDCIVPCCFGGIISIVDCGQECE